MTEDYQEVYILSDPRTQVVRYVGISTNAFLANAKNAVCAILAHQKCGKCQPGKVMQENSPFVL